MGRKSVLFIGESCFAQSFEYKGYDSFAQVQYRQRSGEIMKERLEEGGYDVTLIPCHLVACQFPRTMEELSKFDAVVFSDVGANTFLLLPDMLKTGVRTVNLLKLVKEYIRNGGGFLMIGGYMTFAGYEGKAKYGGSVLEEALPVSVLPYDDRVETPDGTDLVCEPDSHPVLKGMPRQWPYILGYNRTVAKAGADVLISSEGDPILTCGVFGKGRVIAYASDCAGHWGPAALTEWEHYNKLWHNMMAWLCYMI